MAGERMAKEIQRKERLEQRNTEVKSCCQSFFCEIAQYCVFFAYCCRYAVVNAISAVHPSTLHPLQKASMKAIAGISGFTETVEDINKVVCA
jgi:hypothetical protein